MSKILKLPFGADVSAIQDALEAHPELWNQNTGRTADPASPHHGLDDIWVRYAADGVDGSQPHESVWRVPEDILPVRSCVYALMGAVRGDQLGGVLITRIPPGGLCKPHTDPGWHARHYEKIAVQIKGDDMQAFCFRGEELVTKDGEIFWFDNAHEHWVENASDRERITMIVCIRTREFDDLKEPV